MFPFPSLSAKRMKPLTADGQADLCVFQYAILNAIYNFFSQWPNSFEITCGIFSIN